MHWNRLMALTGVIIGIMGLSMEGLTTAGEPFMADLSKAIAGFPDGIPTIWGGSASWAQPVVALLFIAVVVFALRPDRAAAMDRNSTMTVAVIGVALLAYAVYKMIDAGTDADNLAAAFTGVASQGGLPAAFPVDIGFGFLVLIVGAVLVTFGGAIGFMESTDD